MQKKGVTVELPQKPTVIFYQSNDYSVGEHDSDPIIMIRYDSYVNLLQGQDMIHIDEKATDEFISSLRCFSKNTLEKL